MCFLLAGARGRRFYLETGLATILVVVVSSPLSHVLTIGVGVALLVVVGLTAVAIAASLRHSRTRFAR